MTANQWKMLDLLEHYDGFGTMEVRINFGEYDFGDTEADEAKAWRVNGLVVASIVRSLVKKGLARDDGDGYGITDRGRELLEERRRRAAALRDQTDQAILEKILSRLTERTQSVSNSREPAS